MEDWLASIGLAHRIAAFQAQGIRADQLGALTEQDLRELGLPIGERKVFLRAVIAGGLLDPQRLAAERRPLSMMFVDVVGSSRLAEKLAPEDLMELLRRYGDFCAGPITRYGGRITRMVGDGILAYFCFPVANENDPERAVRAALDITRGVGALEVPGGEALSVRIGIATGPVVVGDLHTAGNTYRHAVVGAAPNLAARLQGLVPPGGIAIGEATWERVRERFVCADLGSFELRGMSQARHVWQVLREAAHGRIARPRPSPLCGRAAELAALQAAWARARDGQGGLAVMTGEAGIGKSRLTQAFVEGARGEARVIRLEGSAFETDSPLRPLIAWLRELAGDGFDGEPEGSARLAHELRGWGEHGAVMASLLGLPDAADLAGTPEQVREATLAAAVGLLLAEAGARPLLLVLEDLHWFDPTTLDLVARLARRLGRARAMMVLTARSDFALDEALGWRAPPAGSLVLPLPRLGEGEVADLAAAMLARRAPHPALLRAIGRKAGGVPLFVEEVVRALLARGDAGLTGLDGDGEGPDLAIPASVHELLAGRLDRLGEAKEIAQAAAVIGREVPRDILARVCAAQFGTSAEVLDDALEVLVGAGILTEGEGVRRAGAFTHALLRDAAYASLLREPCQGLHRHTAQALLESDPEIAAAQPELVAAHFAEGGEPQLALPHWIAAGRRALARSALTEATRLLGRGIAALDLLPRTPALLEQRLEVMGLLGPPLMELKGYGSEEAARLYGEANALCQELEESPRHFPIYFGWWRVSRDNFGRLDRANALLTRARRRGDPELLLQAHHCAWASEFFVGSYARCCAHAEAGLAIYEQHDVRHHMHLYGGHDAKVCGHGELALAHWMMGRPLTARVQDRLGQDWAHSLDHLGSLVHNCEYRLYRHAWTLDLERAAAESQELMRLAEEHGLQDVRAKAMIFLGWATATRADPVAGRRLLEEGWTRQLAIGTNEDFPVYVSLLAEVLIAAGEPDAAGAALEQAELDFDRTGLWFWRSEVRRMRARAMLAAGREEERARALLRGALELAEEQGAAMLALRAATELARLDPGEAELRRLLACLHGVAEDDGGAEIAEARLLLRRHAPLADVAALAGR